jgi:hypothetical protein
MTSMRKGLCSLRDFTQRHDPELCSLKLGQQHSLANFPITIDVSGCLSDFRHNSYLEGFEKPFTAAL